MVKSSVQGLVYIFIGLVFVYLLQGFPISVKGWMRNYAGGICLFGGENLRNDYDHSNFFQS